MFITFIVNEPMDLVLFGKAFDGIDFVLDDARAQVACHSDVKRAAAAVRM